MLEFEERIRKMLDEKASLHDPGPSYPTLIRLQLVLACPWEGCSTTPKDARREADELMRQEGKDAG